MRRSRLGLTAALAMAALCAPHVHAATPMAPGQQLLYTGTLTLKQSSQGQAVEVSGPVKLEAVVMEADPTRGYAITLLRQFEPEQKPGQPRFPPDSGLVTLRFDASLMPTTPPTAPAGMLDAFSQVLLKAPVLAQEQKAPPSWHRSELLSFLPPRPLELVYSVVGDGKSGDRTCQKIEKKLAQTLPYKIEQGSAVLELTDYSQTLCVDPVSGTVLSNSLHQAIRLTNGERVATLDFTASSTLQDTRQLPAADLSARVRQASVIERGQQALSSRAPGANRRKALAVSARDLETIRHDYPDSPYATALDQLSRELGQTLAQAQQEARLGGLTGHPAPAFTLASLSGQKHQLAAYHGKIVVLSFFASWCGPCNQEAPHLEREFWQKYRKRGVVVIGVNAGEQGEQAQKAQLFRDRHSLTYPILLDAGDHVLHRYGVMAFPTSIVIDRKGVVRLTEVGYNPASLAAAVERLVRASKG